MAPSLFQPTRRLRNKETDGQHKHRRYRQHQKDVAPANHRQQEVRQHARGHKTQRPEAIHQGDVTAASLGGDQLRQHRLGNGKLHAHANAQQDPEQRQRLHRLRHGTQVARQAPEYDAPLEHRLAPEAISKHPGQRSAHHHAEKTRTGQQPGLGRAQAKLGFDRAQQEGHHRQVHGVEEKRQGDDDENDSVVTADGQPFQAFRRAITLPTHAAPLV